MITRDVGSYLMMEWKGLKVKKTGSSYSNPKESDTAQSSTEVIKKEEGNRLDRKSVYLGE